MSAIDEYFENVDPAQKAEFERVRKIVKQVAPDTEEVISYGIPTFKYKGKYLLYFGVFKNHMSLFPGSAILGKLKEELADYRVSKGTVQFTLDKPLPESVIKKILHSRLAEISKNLKDYR